MNRETVAIIGLGLIGGSLARDLAARGVRVVAHDRDPEAVRAAMRDGVVGRELDARLDGIEEADTVVLAVPVSAMSGLLGLVAARSDRAKVVMDVGSTKRGIVDAAARSVIADRFVGAHPFAGDHRSGYEASRPDLFAGARVFLSPTGLCSREAIDSASALWASIGAFPEIIDARAHDALVAMTSHLPQIVSTALALGLASHGISRTQLGTGGESMTRLAGSSPEMWSAICSDNRDELIGAVSAFRRELDRIGAAIESGPDDTRLLLARARQWFREAD